MFRINISCKTEVNWAMDKVAKNIEMERGKTYSSLHVFKFFNDIKGEMGRDGIRSEVLTKKLEL